MECQKCKIWNLAAKEAGKDGGMCKECFDKSFVHYKPIYDPYYKNDRDNFNAK